MSSSCSHLACSRSATNPSDLEGHKSGHDQVELRALVALVEENLIPVEAYFLRQVLST